MIFILFFVLLHIPLSDFSNIDYISALTLFSFYALILLFLGFYSNPGFIIYFWGLNLIALQTIIIIGLDKSDGYEKGCKIIENIKDQAILAFIACKTNKWSIGYTAIQKITDKEFIELISNEAILERVKDDARKQLKIYDNLHQS
jgi:hypothetical protein